MNPKKTADEKADEYYKRLYLDNDFCDYETPIQDAFKSGHAEGVKEGYLMAVEELRKARYLKLSGGRLIRTNFDETAIFLEANGKDKGIL